MTEESVGVEQKLLAARVLAQLLEEYCFGLEPWMPAYPTHGAPRRCPFCGRGYRVHGGFADHRDRCEEGPLPGANPTREGST